MSNHIICYCRQAFHLNTPNSLQSICQWSVMNHCRKATQFRLETLFISLYLLQRVFVLSYVYQLSMLKLENSSHLTSHTAAHMDL